MAIKISLGRLQLAQPFETFIPHQLSLNRIGLLGITMSHTAKVATLPFHHRDPFDRLLVAQVQVEQMPLVSSDPAFDAYGITRLWRDTDIVALANMRFQPTALRCASRRLKRVPLGG